MHFPVRVPATRLRHAAMVGAAVAAIIAADAAPSLASTTSAHTPAFTVTKAGAAAKAAATCGPGNPKLLAAVIGTRDDLYWCAPYAFGTSQLGPYSTVGKTTTNALVFDQYPNTTNTNAQGKKGWSVCYFTDEATIVLRGKVTRPGRIQLKSTKGC
jgi:hypothetical protein